MDCRISGIDARAAAHQAHLDADADFEAGCETFQDELARALEACWTDGKSEVPVKVYRGEGVRRRAYLEYGDVVDVLEEVAGHDEEVKLMRAVLCAATPDAAMAAIKTYRAWAEAKYTESQGDDLARLWMGERL